MFTCVVMWLGLHRRQSPDSVSVTVNNLNKQNHFLQVKGTEHTYALYIGQLFSNAEVSTHYMLG